MEKYLDSALLIAAISVLLHLDRQLACVRRQIQEHIAGHFHEIKKEG